MAWRRCVVSTFVSTLLAVGLHAQTTWWVDGSAAPGGDGSPGSPFTGIQEGIGAASSGDVIRVFPGTYFERIDYLMKSITIESTHGAQQTTLRGNQDGSVVTLRAVQPVLAGFTIENGAALDVAGRGNLGGGIHVYDTLSAEIRDCVVRGNRAVTGGGIGVVSARGRAIGCTIEDNWGSTGFGECYNGDGGGVYAPQHFVLEQCTIRGNRAINFGGGVYGATLNGCTVENNEAPSGAGLYASIATSTYIRENYARSCDDSFSTGGGAMSCELTDCVIELNFAWDEGGGVRNSNLLRCRVIGNAVTAPLTPWGGWGGGAINSTAVECWFEGNWVFSDPWSPQSIGGGMNGGSALRTVFVDNRADIGAGVAYTNLDRCVVHENVGPGVQVGDVLTNSIVRENSGAQVVNPFGVVSWSNVQGGAAGIGNIDLDPAWWNPQAPARDYRLLPGSPCIDTGDPAVSDPDGSRVDMGAYPFDPTVCAPPVHYCPRGTSTEGCQPQIGTLGLPSATLPDGFVIRASDAPGARAAMLVYGINGRQQLPWGAASFSCVAPPRQRTTTLNSGGTPGACDGMFALDFNAWMTAHPTALGAPFGTGDMVWAQFWFRDPASAQTTQFTDAIEFMFCDG